MWKRLAASTLLRLIRSELAQSTEPINRVLGEAYDMQTGRLHSEDFRKRLDAFFCHADIERLKIGVDLSRQRDILSAPNAYKVDVHDWKCEQGSRSAWKARPWRRRFAYLRHLGVRCDLLILRSGQQIPPHGHYRVVSGFYVLEGNVAFQHYHRIRDEGTGLRVRQTMNVTCGPGGYSTNSEFHDNIHWLKGLADRSYLFRFTVVGVPGETFSDQKVAHDERAYVDPTGRPDDRGEIFAPYIDAAKASELVMEHSSDTLQNHVEV